MLCTVFCDWNHVFISVAELSIKLFAVWTIHRSIGSGDGGFPVPEVRRVERLLVAIHEESRCSNDS
jgi:hypothetical protein